MAKVTHKKADVDGFNVFYREAGPKDAPVLLLLHGFPTSSHMFRDLIPQLADRFHIVAPDLPGFGQSDMPPRDKFAYTFDNIAARHRPLHGGHRAQEVRDLHLRLRCADWFAHRDEAPRARHGDHHAERQCL